MRAPTPNPHTVGTPEWAEHDDQWFRELHHSGELHQLMATITRVGTHHDQAGA